MANAPKAHESLSTEAQKVPVRGTAIPLICISQCYTALAQSEIYILINVYSNKMQIIVVGKDLAHPMQKCHAPLAAAESPCFPAVLNSYKL